MDHLRYWAEDVMTRTPARPKRSHRVGGEFEQAADRQQYAKIEFLVEPAEGFEVAVDVEGAEDDPFWKGEHADWGVLGLLDVVLVAWSQPMRDIKVTIVGVAYDPLWSSPMAFRFAGREAGRKLLEAERARGRE